MTDETQVKELLVVWEELRDRGEHLSAHELCERHGCPELADELQRQIWALQSLDRKMRSTDAQAGDAHIHEQPTITPSPQPNASHSPDSLEAGPKALGGEAPTPRAFGRYRVIAELGSGGFGTVYKAHDPELHRDVAIKVPHRSRTGRRTPRLT
jgi:hypothetical protein